MTDSRQPPTPESPNDSNSPSTNKTEQPNTHNKAHGVWYWLRISLLVIFVLLLVIAAALYIMAGTTKGTQFILNKIASETSVELEYGNGNLRDGLLIHDIKLSASEDIEVHFIDAYVKIGWRALFAREVHLRDADIESIAILNHKPPTGDPFIYKDIELPINLRFDRARIGQIVYNQAQKEPVIVNDILASDLAWVGTKVSVDEGRLEYGDLADITQLSGFINLQGEYPLDINATVDAKSLDNLHVDPLDIHAKGTLKRTYGVVESHYNGTEVQGEFNVQALDPSAPFHAKLMWDEVTLPYAAESQDITLQNGVVILSGVTSNIGLRINTKMSAVNIPSGHYQGRATIRDSQMFVEYLAVTTPDGDLGAQGVLSWQEDFTAKVMLYGDHYRLAQVLPDAAVPYAPEMLNGALAVVYDLKNDKGLMQINADVKQHDGEHIHAEIIQGETPDDESIPAPWIIDGNWDNLTLKDVPQVGDIDSPTGQVDVRLQGETLTVTADAQINELNAAPQGRYQLRLNKQGDKIDISRFNYDGEMGDLTGEGNIVLARESDDADASTPLIWQVKAQTTHLLPQVFKADLPVQQLKGSIDASGQMISSGGNSNDSDSNGTDKNNNNNNNTHHDAAANRKTAIRARKGVDKKNAPTNTNDANHKNGNQTNTKNGNQTNNKNNTPSMQHHEVTINAIDMSAILTSQVKNANGVDENRHIAVTGNGAGGATLVEGELTDFAARFDGQVNTQGVPAGDLTVDMANSKSNSKNIIINKLNYEGDAGDIITSGRIDVSNGINWDIKAKMQAFNVGKFVPQTEAIVTGTLASSGQWRRKAQSKTGDLKAFEINFEGAIDTPSLPQGRLVIDAGGTGQSIRLRKFMHRGEAGSLSAKGTIDVSNGIKWDINAAMDKFNLGYFVQSMPSTVTGRLQTNGTWQDDVQRINITEMALRGEVQNKPLIAKGQLQATLHLPQDMDSYLSHLKTADTNQQANQLNSIIETLEVDDLRLQWAENTVIANGDINRLQVKMNVRDLQQFSQELTGNVTGGLIVVQSPNQPLPTVYVDLTANDVSTPSMQLSQGKIKGKVVGLGKRPSDLVIVTDGLQASTTTFNDMTVIFKGTEQQHTLSLLAKANSNNTEVGVQAVLQGGFARDNNQWRGVIGKGKLSTPYVSLIQRQPAQLLLDLGSDSPQIQLAAHCWQATDQSGKLCLRDNLVASANSGRVDLAIQQLDTSLFSPFLPNDLSWQAQVNGKILAGWQQGKNPSIRATVYTDNGEIGMTQEGAAPIKMPYKRISLIVNSVPRGLEIRTDIDSGQGASGYADVILNPFIEQKPITGDVVLNEFNLAVVKSFFPGMRKLTGNITLDARVNGTLSNPIMNGEARLSNASVAMLDLPVDFNNINATAQIEGQHVTLDGSFMSGEGVGRIDGNVDWVKKLQAQFRIRGERLVVTQPPLLVAEVSPDINVIVRPNEKYVSIIGAVTVPSATIRPPDANNEVIAKSEDVVVLDRRLIGNIDEVLAITQPWSINADIGVDLGSDVTFRGFGAVLPLAGALHLTQQGQGIMVAKGVVQVSRRTDIDAFGRNLELNYAQIRFNGNVTNPNLSIEAVTDVEDKTVGVRVKGRASDPNITVFNDAGLTQQQAINALITGRLTTSSAAQTSEQGFKSKVTNSLAAAGLNVGFQGTRGLTNSIGKAFGLQRLTLGASGTADDANVNVTGYISPDLYIRYGVGVFNAQTSLSLRYQLTNRVYIEATSSIESAVDMVYSFQF